MQLSTEHIAEFQALYKQQLGIELSKENACDTATRLLRLFQLIYTPMTKEEFKHIQQQVQIIRTRINKQKQAC